MPFKDNGICACSGATDGSKVVPGVLYLSQRSPEWSASSSSPLRSDMDWRSLKGMGHSEVTLEVGVGSR